VQPPSKSDKTILPIAEGARPVAEILLDEAESSDVPRGTVWNLHMRANGALGGGVQFNLDEFEASTAQSWATSLQRLLASAVRDPDQDWRQL
jgi:hypothetical protein